MKITNETLKRIIKEELSMYLEEEQLNEKLMLKKGKDGWWKFSQLVAEAYRAAPMMDQAAVEGYKVLGLVARGTENILHHPQYGTFGIEDYINYVKAYLQENKDIDKVYIVSEDSHWVEALHKALPNSYFVPDVFRRTDETMEYMNRVHCWPCVSNKRKNQAQLLGEEIILQAKLLGKCQHLAGKHGGIMAGGVLWSENTEKVSIMKPC